MEKQYVTFEEALDEYVEASRNPEAGVPTGYSVDELGTMNTGELTLLWARSGAGKSTLLLNLIANQPDVPTVFFNMEMRARTMAEWLATMSGNLGVGYHRIKEVIAAGDSDRNYAEVMDQLQHLKDRKPPLVWMAETDRPTVDDLARVVDQITVDTGIRPVRIMVDHFHLMAQTRDY